MRAWVTSVSAESSSVVVVAPSWKRASWMRKASSEAARRHARLDRLVVGRLVLVPDDAEVPEGPVEAEPDEPGVLRHERAVAGVVLHGAERDEVGEEVGLLHGGAGARLIRAGARDAQ